MESTRKHSKRQHEVEEENKWLEEIAKKREMRRLEEINRLEQAASRKLQKQRKQECKHLSSVNAFHEQQLNYQHHNNNTTDKYNESEILFFNQVDEQNNELEEAGKKKQKRQLEEINQLEQAANRQMEKQRKQELNEVANKKLKQQVEEINKHEQKESRKKYQCAIATNRLEHVVRRKAPLTINEVNFFNEVEIIQQQSNRFTIGNEVNHLQYQANRPVRHEVMHLQQEVNRATMTQDVSVNDAVHLEQMIYQQQNNRITDEDSQLEMFLSDHNEFTLRNPQLSMQDAVNFLDKKDPFKNKWSDFEKSPVKSLLLWYANAGCFSFDEYKEYSTAFNGKQMDVEKLKKEISNEALSDEELGKIIKKYNMNHSYTEGNLYACAACGMRQLEQLQPKIEYLSIPLKHAWLEPLKYTDDEKKAYRDAQEMLGLQVPHDGEGHFMRLHAWKVISVYENMFDDNLYHLHPELVDVDEAGIESIRICPTCLSKLKAKEKPPLSIAAGIDFGYYRRVKDLEMPNLHESIILSLNEVVHVTIKISSNRRGHVNFGLNRLKAHVILWPQTSVSSSLADLNPTIVFDQEFLKKHSSVKYYFLDPTGKQFDHMTQMAFSSPVFLPRPWVLYQWFILLFKVHRWYTIYSFPGYPEFEQMMQAVITDIRNSAIRLDNANDLQLEDAIGSDVAQVQSTEIDDANANDENDMMIIDGENTSDGSLPLRYSFVLPSCQDDHLNNETKLRAFQKMVKTGPTELPDDDYQIHPVHNAPEDTEAIDINSIFNENLDFETEEEHLIVTSIRGHDPVNDFDKTDKVITTSFPHVFLLGRAYGRATGNWTEVQRRHLLGQFTLVPAKARSLLGYMFDILTRVESINGVVSCVKGNKKSITAISAIMQKLQENNSILQKAIAKPNSKGAKKIINTIVPYLQFASRNIQYGFFQSYQVKPKLLETIKYYGNYTAFITLSFNDTENPVSFRASFHTVSNKAFPAVFEQNSI